jgi:hypothetical protein
LFDGISRINQVYEVHALDHTPFMDVEARDDADG